MGSLFKFLRTYFFLISFFAHVSSKENCLKEVDKAVYPTCEIIDHGSPGSYECLEAWENSIYLGRDGNVTLDCWAAFPIDFDYNGVKPIKNLDIQFYKRMNESNGPMSYGIKIKIIESQVEYSGDYIFHSLGQPTEKVTIYVFAEKRDLPQFLETTEGKHVMDAFLDPDENAIIIPCRTANFNATVLGVYLNFEDLIDEIDGINFRYDPRRGFIRKIPPEDSDIDIYGTYECYTEWKTSGRDRMKVRAEAPASIYDSDEIFISESEEVAYSTEETPGPIQMTVLPGIIAFHPVPDKKFKAECTLPEATVQGHTPFFANAIMGNPTMSRLNSKCAHLDSSCGDHIRILGHSKTSPNVIEIPSVHPSGLVQCVVSTNMEMLEYFIGADDHIYFDWNVALADQGLVKVIPAKDYPRYTIHGNFQFTCRFPSYVGVYPIWWGVNYKNGTLVESYESDGNTKSFSLDIEVSEIECGVTIWNSSTWYKASHPIEVVDYVLPVLVEKNRRMSFKTDAVNQALRCEVEPGPKTTLEWYRNGKKVENIPILDLENTSVLYFERINTTFEGNYTCKASTKSGSVEAEFQILLDEGLDKDPPKNHGTQVIIERSNCREIGELILYDTKNLEEVGSLDEIREKEILLLELSQQNCSDGSSARDSFILVRLLEKNTKLNNLESSLVRYSEENVPEDLAGDSLEDESEESVEDDRGKVGRHSGGRDKHHILLPYIIGLTILAVVLIIGFIAYSYFCTPWKQRSVTTVST